MGKRRSKSLCQKCPTNAVLEEYDNLETKMKHANAHNAEKLYHFINKQSEYVEGFKVDLDMYRKPSGIALPKASYLLTKEEEIDVNNFRQSVLSKANEVALVYDHEKHVEALSQNQGNDNSATRDRLDTDRREGSNILKKEEVTWEHPVTTVKYMRIDKLYSASMADVKTKLDKTIEDHDLFKFDYCKIANLSPMLYANKSSVFHQLKWEEKSPGKFVGNVPMFSLHWDCNLPEKTEHLENVPLM